MREGEDGKKIIEGVGKVPPMKAEAGQLGLMAGGYFKLWNVPVRRGIMSYGGFGLRLFLGGSFGKKTYKSNMYTFNPIGHSAEVVQQDEGQPNLIRFLDGGNPIPKSIDFSAFNAGIFVDFTLGFGGLGW